MDPTPVVVPTLLPGPGEVALAPISGAPIVTSPTPGYKTSEAWIALLVILLGGLLSSGVVVETSQLGKMITFAVSAITGLGYVHQRTQLKIAHVTGATLAPFAPDIEA